MALLKLIKGHPIERDTRINEEITFDGETKILPIRIPQVLEKIEEEFDRCVYCWRLTDIPRSLPLNKRLHYVEGGGQLCGKCYALVECGAYPVDGANDPEPPFPNPNYHRPQYHNI